MIDGVCRRRRAGARRRTALPRRAEHRPRRRRRHQRQPEPGLHAMGDTVNLAARMEQAPQPGAVYLTENTYRAVRDYVECEPVGPVEVKGKSEPVATYRAVREMPTRSRLEIAGARGLTPFVGRKQELASLRRSFEQVQARRRPGHLPVRRGRDREVPSPARVPPLAWRRRDLAGGPLRPVRGGLLSADRRYRQERIGNR